MRNMKLVILLSIFISLSSQVFSQDNVESIRENLVSKTWKLVSKKSSLGDDFELNGLLTMALQFRPNGSGVCMDFADQDQARNSNPFEWVLKTSYDNEPEIVIYKQQTNMMSRNRDNFLYGPENLRINANAKYVIFNIRILSDPERERPITIKIYPSRQEEWYNCSLLF